MLPARNSSSPSSINNAAVPISAMDAKLLISSTDVGMLAIDQSKQREAGHRRSQALQAIKYEWVRNCVRREEAGFSVSRTTDSVGTVMRALRSRISSDDTTMKPARFVKASTHSGRWEQKDLPEIQ